MLPSSITASIVPILMLRRSENAGQSSQEDMGIGVGETFFVSDFGPHQIACWERFLVLYLFGSFKVFLAYHRASSDSLLHKKRRHGKGWISTQVLSEGSNKEKQGMIKQFRMNLTNRINCNTRPYTTSSEQNQWNTRNRHIFSHKQTHRLRFTESWSNLISLISRWMLYVQMSRWRLLSVEPRTLKETLPLRSWDTKKTEIDVGKLWIYI